LHSKAIDGCVSVIVNVKGASAEAEFVGGLVPIRVFGAVRSTVKTRVVAGLSVLPAPSDARTENVY
jgi:hypothetical protein